MELPSNLSGSEHSSSEPGPAMDPKAKESRARFRHEAREARKAEEENRRKEALRIVGADSEGKKEGMGGAMRRLFGLN